MKDKDDDLLDEEYDDEWPEDAELSEDEAGDPFDRNPRPEDQAESSDEFYDQSQAEDELENEAESVAYGFTPAFEDEIDEDLPEDDLEEEDSSKSAFFAEGSRVKRLESRRGGFGRFFLNLLLSLTVLVLIGASAYLVATKVDFGSIAKLFQQTPEKPKVIKAVEKQPKETEKKAEKETKAATESAKPKEAEEPAAAPKVRILNGNGLTGEADRIAENLRSGGAEILDKTNADKSTYDKTLVSAKPEFMKAAQDLAARLGNEYAADVSPTLPGSDTADVQVILGAPKLEFGAFKTAVLNGNNIKGEAAVIANHLKGKGWQIVRQENADRVDYAKTLIRFKPDLTALAKIAQKEISTRYPAELKAELPPDSTEDIQIILGRDKK